MAPLRVLQLVTSPRPFFRQQVRALGQQEVRCTTVSVPADAGDRGPVEYLSFFLHALGRSLGRFDLIHANYGLTGAVAIAQPRRPVVLTLWGSDLLGDSAMVTALTRRAAIHADAVIVPSERMSAELSCPHRIVPFGVDTELFRPMDRATAREDLEWPGDEHIVLFPYDRDRTVKNHSRARRIVDALPIDARLETVSGVEHWRMPYYMNASDALLVTSDRESGPMVVPEAVACGLPVVSTDVGFVADVLADVEPAAVCESTEEMITALTSILESGDRCDPRATVPTLDEMGSRLREVYAEVVDDSDEPADRSAKSRAD